MDPGGSVEVVLYFLQVSILSNNQSHLNRYIVMGGQDIHHLHTGPA